MVRLAMFPAILLATGGQAQPVNLAASFAARPQVQDASMSPDGNKIALVMPGKGRATGVVILDVKSDEMKPVYAVSGDPDQIAGCFWVGDARIACTLWGVVPGSDGPMGYSAVIAMDDSGANVKMLSRKQESTDLYSDTRGGEVIDLLPEENGAVLMTRAYVPQEETGTVRSVHREGFGVDKVDTRTGSSRMVIPPDRTAAEFITDGHGIVRISGYEPTTDQGYAVGRVAYKYRSSATAGWKPLSVQNYQARTGFTPAAVDRVSDVAYGFEPIDGRDALVSYKLDGSMVRSVLVKNPTVDVDRLITIGRARRVIGAGYTTDRSYAVYFDPEMRSLQQKLEKALGGNHAVTIVDASASERKVIVLATSDVDPGKYYYLDRDTNKLATIVDVDPALNGIPLAPVRSISYRANDGTEIPAYLTLPLGSSAKNLPAIVMPHGGPEARDYWGYDALVQYFVSRGFAVIQPQFRGSTGFGSSWFQKNGFRGWRTSIGDVDDAGHYLISSGIADPKKLVIFGWSYGGYAALQSTVLEPGLFKAAVAVAPVTDLAKLQASRRRYSDYLVEQDRIGGGTNVIEGSPARNADKIKVPVLIFHGTYDLNVPFDQSKLMNDKLRASGGQSELVVFDKLDHGLRDPAALQAVLQRSADFLAKAGN